ncbi:MAG TPA: sulfurtransferase [Terriglobales bacterium]|nr:sulfurtransferase [Terriglobales bacterium]
MIVRLAAFFLLSLSLFAQTTPAHPEMLVSTQWLADHLRDSSLVIIQIGPKQNEYDAGHIPGARFLPNDHIVAERNGVKGELLPDEQLVSNLEALGINNDSRIVIYASEYPTVATRLYWTLDYLGIADHASLLNGGLQQWKAENRPVPTETLPFKPGKIQPHRRPEVLATAADVQSATHSGTPLLVDSRPQKRFAEGHIPGAVPLYWQQTVAPDQITKFLDAGEIESAYKKAGVKPGTKVITYCETGFQATHSYFTLKYLGYDVKMYDGSFNEWNDVKHLPVVKDDKP